MSIMFYEDILNVRIFLPNTLLQLFVLENLVMFHATHSPFGSVG